MLASAMEPATLAHTYITDRGTFKPAPQPPRKTPTAPKNPKLPEFALLGEEEAEAQLAQSLAGHGCAAVDGEQCHGQDGTGMITDEEVETVLQQWFREQKHFQDNAALRRQHVRLSRQIAQLQNHLAGTATGAKAAARPNAVRAEGKLQRPKQVPKS